MISSISALMIIFAHTTRLGVDVDRGARDVDSVARCLDDGVLLGMESAADLMALPRGNAELLAQASGLGAVRKSRRHARCTPSQGCGAPSR